MRALSGEVYGIYERCETSFHTNVRSIIDECFPGASFRDQLRKTWITESRYVQS